MKEVEPQVCGVVGMANERWNGKNEEVPRRRRKQQAIQATPAPKSLASSECLGEKRSVNLPDLA
jgi:hypothetical protein